MGIAKLQVIGGNSCGMKKSPRLGISLKILSLFLHTGKSQFPFVFFVRPAKVELNMDAPDWRTQLHPDSRQRIVTKITETLKRHRPISGPEGLTKLRKISAMFEQKMFSDATSQSDYLRKISLRMVTMETKSQPNRVAKSLPLSTAGGSQIPQHPVSQSMQSQVRNPGQLQISLANQSLARQQLLTQKIENDVANPGIQGPRSCSQIRTNHSNIEPNREATDWKTLLQSESRIRIVTKIVEALKRHLPINGPEGLVELGKIAVRFEEQIFTAATSQMDYLRKISLKMLTLETKSQKNVVANSLPLNAAGGSQNPRDPASQSMQSQVRSPGQLQISLANQSLARQQLLTQKIENDVANPGIQGPRSCSQIRTNHSNIEPNREATDWKTLLQPESRIRIVTKMVETLKEHLPITAPEELVELNKVAVRVEEKIFTAAVSQMDYLRKISLKMLTLETKSQKIVVANSSPLNSAGGSQNPRDPASHSMQSQVSNLGQSHISLANQSLAQQQLLSQNIQINTISPVIQGPISNHSDIESNVDKALLEPGSRQSNVTKVSNAVIGGDRLWEASHDQNTENHHPVGGIHIWDAGRPETHKIEPEVGGFLSWDGGPLRTNYKGLEGRGFRLCSDGNSETETDRKEPEEPGYLDLTLKL